MKKKLIDVKELSIHPKKINKFDSLKNNIPKQQSIERPGEYDYIYPVSVQLFEKHNIQIVIFLLCMMQNKQSDFSFFH